MKCLNVSLALFFATLLYFVITCEIWNKLNCTKRNADICGQESVFKTLLSTRLLILMHVNIPYTTCLPEDEPTSFETYRRQQKLNIKLDNCVFRWFILCNCRSQWPRGLRRRSAAASLLRPWVRIPPGAWIFVCCECRVLLGRGLCDELITRPEESYRLCCVVVCDLETSRMGAPYIYIYIYIN